MLTAAEDTNHSQPNDYVISQNLLPLLLLIETEAYLSIWAFPGENLQGSLRIVKDLHKDL